MEDDYYALLNLSRTCTEDEIKTAYKRLCVHYHPDKHKHVNRESAELVFCKIRKAYEVLSNPQMRTIYDIYGAEGVDSGWHLALHDMNRNQIKETYERMVRQKQDKEQERATNPISNMLIRLDASGLCYSQQSNYLSDLLTIPLEEFSLTQSVDAPLTDSHKATIICTARNRAGEGVGQLTTNMRHTVSPSCWLNSSFTIGDGSIFTLNGYKSLTKYLFSSFDSEVAIIDREYLSYGGGITLGCNVDEHVLKVRISADRQLHGIIERSWDKLKIYASYKLGLENQILMVHVLRPIRIHEPGDAHVECSAKYNLLQGAELEYGVAKKLTDFSRLAALVRISQASGVRLKLLLTRGNHSYRFDINFSDVIEPVAVVYGTVLPVFVYSALHWLVIKPYLKRQQEEEMAEKTSQLAEALERKREEAKAAIVLMKETYQRNVNSEQCKGGLVIIQAWYGVFGVSNKLIDVTIPLQCLVFNSKLILPDETKAGMVGFYDVGLGEEKQLSVKYRFRNVMHEVMIGDTECLKIPKQSHKIS